MIIKAIKKWDKHVTEQDRKYEAKLAKDSLARTHFGFPDWETYERVVSQAEHMERHLFMAPPDRSTWWNY